jgi:hypothetical protein
MTMSHSNGTILVVHFTSTEIALVSVAVAAASVLSAYLASKRERRRKLYSDAIQAILKWSEMVYRVRRRDPQDGRHLVNTFHDLQENLTSYEAWIACESKYMSRSYSRLVTSVKAASLPLIQEAWRQTRDVPGDALPADVHPDLKIHVDEFASDVRSHLTPLPWRKWSLAYRNRSSRS